MSEVEAFVCPLIKIEIVLADEESLALGGVGLQSIMGGRSSSSLTVSDCLLVSEESLALPCLLMGGGSSSSLAFSDCLMVPLLEYARLLLGNIKSHYRSHYFRPSHYHSPNRSRFLMGFCFEDKRDPAHKGVLTP